MQSKAATVEQYLAELPGDRREAISAVRNAILNNLDKGYQERMAYGMIGYSVPHSVFPAGYHCDPKAPLPFAGLALQKQHMSLYLMGVYCGCDGKQDTDLLRWFKNAWAGSGKKKLDMGRACIRFKSLNDIPLDVVGEAIRRMPLKTFVAEYEKTLAMIAGAKPVRTAAKAKPAPKKTAGKATKSRAKKPAAKTGK